MASKSESIAAVDRLLQGEKLAKSDFLALLAGRTDGNLVQTLTDQAVLNRQKIFGRQVYLRGIIEFSNICRNDCYYCGIRKSNDAVERFCLSTGQILDCCQRGYEAGIRTFVLQGGENPGFDKTLLEIVRKIRLDYPDCAITLSIGERQMEIYREFLEAGANRFLLRHETANPGHYRRLHPENLELSRRLDCLESLKKIGYQTGAGFMVGSPYQTDDCLADDLCFLQDFQPDMIGIGPFIPHRQTPFAGEASGTVRDTLFLLSVLRLLLPKVLLPATTALETLAADGWEQGILAGANVIMLNISPREEDAKYALYDGKPVAMDDIKVQVSDLKARLAGIGYDLVFARGDAPTKF